MRGRLFAFVFFGFAANAYAEGLQLKLPVACEIGRSCFIQNYVDAGVITTCKRLHVRNVDL